ncbi:Fur family transcriptional regulator [Pseudothermotoga thermarum]|uniref:Ferric uptake regulator, Fur family n=1 Tax=Pseudothermotoga thermarum DSM 5069 TaxID=688269 RepID=F7YXQ2_9THEM|nr:Fur family transcriptional regulator [Pseudothermotoga thermarum]AEH50696.1 ferric uptake regulator, Fur family [Pseudothermotoga thermarum DSM 5069]
MTTAEITAILKTHGLKVTPQRVEIVRYLDTYRIHPTAQQIYEYVLAKVGNISFTTVYNTLHSLEKLGYVKKIALDESKVVYDFNVSDHGHFVCTVCGQIYDIDHNVRIENAPGRVLRSELIVYGICKDCLQYH